MYIRFASSIPGSHLRAKAIVKVPRVSIDPEREALRPATFCWSTDEVSYWLKAGRKQFEGRNASIPRSGLKKCGCRCKCMNYSASRGQIDVPCGEWVQNVDQRSVRTVQYSTLDS